MWPFSKPDTRPASVAALAIVRSLKTEPRRWTKHGDYYLKHDSGIAIDMQGWIRSPDLDSEPDANGPLVADAINEWIAASVALPAEAPTPVDAMDEREAANG